jgi:hypothetical protein
MRKAPIKTVAVKLTGAWEGWEFTARTNAPVGVLKWFASGDLENIVRGVAKIIVDWNFVNENGEPYSPTIDGIDENMDGDLLSAVANAYVEKLTSLPPN